MALLSIFNLNVRRADKMDFAVVSTLKRFVTFVSCCCILSFSVLAQATNKRNDFTIKFSASTPVQYSTRTEKNKKTGTATVSWEYSYKAWPLLGEPVQDCKLKWYLFENQSFELYNHYTKAFDKVSPPNEVLRKVDLSIDEVEVYIRPGSYISCDGGAIASPGIIGMGGKEIITAKSSIDTPGSPSWENFFDKKNVNTPKSEKIAKDIFKSLLGRDIQPSSTEYAMTQARLSISDLQRWYREKLDEENKEKKKEEKKEKEKEKEKEKRNQKTTEESKKITKNRNNTAQGQFTKSEANKPSASAALIEGFGGASDISLPKKDKNKTKTLMLQNKNQTGAYRASISGASVPTEQTRTDASGSMVLLIDTSGSMHGNKIREAKKASKELIIKATANATEVSILAFSGSCNSPIVKKHRFSTSRSSLLSFVDSLSTGGGTPMSAAVEYANVYMANNKSESSASEMILLLADGDDECNIMSPVVSKLKNEGILHRHQTVGLEINESSKAVKDLRMIARESGGDYFKASNASQLSSTFENAAIAMGILDMIGQYGTSKNKANRRTPSEQQQIIMSGFGE